MSDNKTEQKTAPRTPPADAAAPFYTLTQFWRGEAQRMLDESAAAMEKGFAEWERTVQESSRYSAAQAHAMHEAGRAFVNGARAMLA